jgi:maltooligosyltrehalose trehalohydrolase
MSRMRAPGENRRMPVGAEPITEGGVDFRVWAPRRSRVHLVLEEGAGAPATVPLRSESEGYHETFVPEARAGTRYRFRLDDDPQLYPDPASRFQPDGPHGPSEVVDPDSFRWTDEGWQGVGAAGHVLYEMHIGTFTPEGTFAAAAEQLPELADFGVTLLEVMPVADFPGRFGWGYDGVNLFAPCRLYGTPDDFRRFVDRAHAVGIGVILDVVYNHLGPDGNFLSQFSETYFTDRYETDWGDPINFHGRGSEPVREFFVTNAAYWMREFHLDGLRLDATQNIYDVGEGADHILAEVVREARSAREGKGIYTVAENEPQESRLVRALSEGGYGIDALWNDDFHHSAMVALTGRKEAYYSDYLGAPQEFVSAAKWGFLYQGQHYDWQKQRRGTPSLDLRVPAFVHFIQNHDQVANSARGDRIHRLTSPGRLRAMTALTLLGPATPMLFMGQEFTASAPFLYFADHDPELAEKVSRGRRAFLQQFPSLAGPDAQAEVSDPADPDTFRRCKLDFTERELNAAAYALHRDLLRIRREDEVLDSGGLQGVDGAVLSGDAFLLRFFGGDGHDRLLVVNLGRDLRFSPAPEPLLAPPPGCRWEVRWSSEDGRYGGMGVTSPESREGGWQIPGEAAIFLHPVPVADGEPSSAIDQHVASDRGSASNGG